MTTKNTIIPPTPNTPLPPPKARRYIIDEIRTEGYERFATIRELEQGVKLNVNFLEYEEYLENGEESGIKKRGDILEGNISIELVTFSTKADEKLSHHQKIQESPHIEAVVEVAQMTDEYSIYALSSILDDTILIEFESAVEYRVGERILVIGSLMFQ